MQLTWAQSLYVTYTIKVCMYSVMGFSLNLGMCAEYRQISGQDRRQESVFIEIVCKAWLYASKP